MRSLLAAAELAIGIAIAATVPVVLEAQAPVIAVRNDSVSIRLIDVELRTAVQMLGQYLDRPILMTGPGGGVVTLETPRPIPRSDVLRLLRGLLDGHGFDLVEDSAAGLYRARSRAPDPQIAPAPSMAQPGGDSAGVQLFVLPLQHARAVDVASTINALYGNGGAFGGDAGRSVAGTQSLADQLRGNLVPPSGMPPGTAPAVPAPVQGQLSGSLTLVADTRTNSLLLRANVSDLALVRGVVEALDKRPLQVLIEVLVAEVRRDRSLGINVEGTLDRTTIGKSGASIEGVLGEAGLGDFAIQVMGLGGLDLTGTLRLAAGRGSVRILTRPVVLATNNESAEIVVGSQRPFVQVQRALPTDGGSRDQIVQYKDVGTKLTVRPTISTDGTVQLEVMQEVSTATSELAFNAPVIATRSVRTQLLVRDGQTVALGGLTDRQRESRQGGIPLLSAIPGLGGLFGRASSQRLETELFIFLTPRIIRTDDDAMRLSDPLRKQVGDRP